VRGGFNGTSPRRLCGHRPGTRHDLRGRDLAQQRSRAKRSATTRTGEGGAGLARPSCGRQLVAGVYAQLLRRVLVHRRGQKAIQLDAHRPPLALALKVLLGQHRRPRGAPPAAAPLAVQHL